MADGKGVKGGSSTSKKTTVKKITPTSLTNLRKSTLSTSKNVASTVKKATNNSGSTKKSSTKATPYQNGKKETITQADTTAKALSLNGNTTKKTPDNKTLVKSTPAINDSNALVKAVKTANSAIEKAIAKKSKSTTPYDNGKLETISQDSSKNTPYQNGKKEVITQAKKKAETSPHGIVTSMTKNTPKAAEKNKTLSTKLNNSGSSNTKVNQRGTVSSMTQATSKASSANKNLGTKLNNAGSSNTKVNQRGTVSSMTQTTPKAAKKNKNLSSTRNDLAKSLPSTVVSAAKSVLPTTSSKKNTWQQFLQDAGYAMNPLYTAYKYSDGRSAYEILGLGNSYNGGSSTPTTNNNSSNSGTITPAVNSNSNNTNTSVPVSNVPTNTNTGVYGGWRYPGNYSGSSSSSGSKTSNNSGSKSGSGYNNTTKNNSNAKTVGTTVQNTTSGTGQNATIANQNNGTVSLQGGNTVTQPNPTITTNTSYGGNYLSIDPNADYKALQNNAIANGDYSLAAKYEALRNAKINYLNATTGTDYDKTYDYISDAGYTNNQGGYAYDSNSSYSNLSTPGTYNINGGTYRSDANGNVYQHVGTNADGTKNWVLQGNGYDSGSDKFTWSNADDAKKYLVDEMIKNGAAAYGSTYDSLLANNQVDPDYLQAMLDGTTNEYISKKVAELERKRLMQSSNSDDDDTVSRDVSSASEIINSINDNSFESADDYSSLYEQYWANRQNPYRRGLY